MISKAIRWQHVELVISLKSKLNIHNAIVTLVHNQSPKDNNMIYMYLSRPTFATFPLYKANLQFPCV